jgi:hypothetical protein
MQQLVTPSVMGEIGREQDEKDKSELYTKAKQEPNPGIVSAFC